MKGIQPLKKNIIVRPIVQKAESAGGIYIPDAFRVTQNKGEVLAVGTGWWSQDGKRVLTEAKVGDIVLYGVSNGIPVRWNGEDLLIIKEDEMLGIEKFDAELQS